MTSTTTEPSTYTIERQKLSILMGWSQVSRRLRVSLTTVVRMATDGRLPVAQRLPGPRGAFLFDSNDIDAYIAAEDAKWAIA